MQGRNDGIWGVQETYEDVDVEMFEKYVSKFGPFLVSQFEYPNHKH